MSINFLFLFRSHGFKICVKSDEKKSMKWCTRKSLFKSLILIFCLASVEVNARPYNYPQTRYISARGHSLGGMTLPLTDEVTNCLFNNPACLAKNMAIQGDVLNLNLEMNSGAVGHFGLTTINSLSLSGMKPTLDGNVDELNGMGFGLSTAFSWGGISAGLLVQERVVALFDGTEYHYSTVSQTIPAVGIGIPLARGVVRLGYSLQLVNETSGIVTTTVPNSFMDGLNEGMGLSHNASVNFVFPFRFLPTVSLAAKNIFGVNYSGGALLGRASAPVGAPAVEPMTLEAALDFQVRISGTAKTHWYLQYKDMASATSLPLLEKLSYGLEIAFNKNFGIQTGFNETQFSLGLGYRGDRSAISLSWYNDQNPLPVGLYWDTRYQLQYTLHFQDKNKRDPEQDRRN